jgi:LCP family protein required for cell wall assembly
VFVVTVTAVGGAYWIAARKVAQVPKVAIDPKLLKPGGNYLLIGSDSRAFVGNAKDSSEFGSASTQTGQRSDTIMLAHVEDSPGKSFLVSFPRDLWVDVPGIGHAKINAAFNAGPQRVIQTIEQNFDVPISHYLEVDFAGFRKLVDAIGTVPIYFPAPARDAKTGLNITTAGCHQLNGDEALAFVRSRYYESFVDGKWQIDGTSDLGRIKRQQYFLRTIAREALHTAERAPWKAPKILDAMLANLQRDGKLGFSSFRAFAYAFHGGGAGMKTYTLPTTPKYIDGQAALLLQDTAAAPLLAQLRGQHGSAASSTPYLQLIRSTRAVAGPADALPAAGC